MKHPIVRMTGYSRFPGISRPPKESRQNPAPDASRSDVRPEQFERRARLVSAIARGRRWLDDVVSGRVTTVAELCTRKRCSVRQVNMTISLALLAPNLVKAAVEGRLPRGIGIERLRDHARPLQLQIACDVKGGQHTLCRFREGEERTLLLPTVHGGHPGYERFVPQRWHTDVPQQSEWRTSHLLVVSHDTGQSFSAMPDAACPHLLRPFLDMRWYLQQSLAMGWPQDAGSA